MLLNDLLMTEKYVSSAYKGLAKLRCREAAVPGTWEFWLHHSKPDADIRETGVKVRAVSKAKRHLSKRKGRCP
jgi:hypothetical protein